IHFRSLEAADRRLSYFYETLERVDAFVAQGDGGEGAVVAGADALIGEAKAAFADDFNAPVVMAALGEAAKLANKLLDEGKGIDKQQRRRSIAKLGRDLRTVGAALGILEQAPKDYLRARRERLVARRGLDVATVLRLVGERDAARKAKDFARGDAIRAELI